MATRSAPSPSSVAGLVAVMLLGMLLAGCSSDAPEGSVDLALPELEVHAIERGPEVGEVPLTVLFLHGAAYTSTVWDRTGILDAVAEAGYRGLAIDLPGYGQTDERPTLPGTELTSDGTWLQEFVDGQGGPDQVVIVSPSMSGTFSLDYLEQHPQDALAGFVPVAPSGIDGFTRPDDAQPVPSLITWGENDPARSPAATSELVANLRSEQVTEVVIAGAGHAAYEDDPEAFIAALLPFLASVTP